MVEVANGIVEKLEELVNPERVMPATVEIVDIAGLVAGASKGEGLGNKFLADLQKLCTQLVALGTALQTPIGAGPPFVPNAAIPVPAVNVTQAAQTIINKIEKYKSKVTTTK